MMNLLFSPSGRMNSGEFMKAAITLIVLAVILSIPSLMGMSQGLQTILGIVSFLLIIPWIFIWIKRYHDGGKSGWMSLLPILVYAVVLGILMSVMMGDVFAYTMQAASEGAGAMDADMEAEIEAMTKAKAVPMTIASTVVSLAIAFLFNATIKQEPNDNQFGPVR